VIVDSSVGVASAHVCIAALDLIVRSDLVRICLEVRLLRACEIWAGRVVAAEDLAACRVIRTLSGARKHNQRPCRARVIVSGSVGIARAHVCIAALDLIVRNNLVRICLEVKVLRACEVWAGRVVAAESLAACRVIGALSGARKRNERPRRAGVIL
jgi:hypothetical protein